MEWTNALTDWYLHHARSLPWRETRDPYRILVSEIMLQQTRVNAVLGYYERFLAEFPTVQALALCDEDALMKRWEGLGYYSRARNLKRAAKVCLERYHGRLPERYEELLTLPGLGEYTAGAVASIAFDLPVPAVDGNVLRVMARIENDDRDIGDPRVKKSVREKLLLKMPKDRPGVFNQALMELGAVRCTPNGAPRCEECPIRAYCRAYLEGKTASLPVKSGKKARKIEEKTVYALWMDGRPLVYRRSAGVLQGLWQLPEAEGTRSLEELAERLSAWGLRPRGELTLTSCKHVFTHLEWHMQVCNAEVTGEIPAGWRRLGPEDALPTAYRICLNGGEN